MCDTCRLFISCNCVWFLGRSHSALPRNHLAGRNTSIPNDSPHVSSVQEHPKSSSLRLLSFVPVKPKKAAPPQTLSLKLLRRAHCVLPIMPRRLSGIFHHAGCEALASVHLTSSGQWSLTPMCVAILNQAQRSKSLKSAHTVFVSQHTGTTITGRSRQNVPHRPFFLLSGRGLEDVVLRGNGIGAEKP